MLPLRQCHRLPLRNLSGRTATLRDAYHRLKTSSQNIAGPRPRCISTGTLNALLRSHARPIYPLVSGAPYRSRVGDLISGAASRLDAFSGYPFRAWLPCMVRLAPQQAHQRRVHSGPLVLGAAPLKSPAPVVDRDQTVSRRFEPSSRTALMGEQTNPWDLLQPQDATSRHRGAKPPRRWELSGEISLLSPG